MFKFEIDRDDWVDDFEIKFPEKSKFIKSFHRNINTYKWMFKKIDIKIIDFIVNCEFNILDCWKCLDLQNSKNEKMFPILSKYLNQIGLNNMTKRGGYIENVIYLLHFVNDFYNKEGKMLINYLVFDLYDFEMINCFIEEIHKIK